jgi:hypothetical protein
MDLRAWLRVLLVLTNGMQVLEVMLRMPVKHGFMVLPFTWSTYTQNGSLHDVLRNDTIILEGDLIMPIIK